MKTAEYVWLALIGLAAGVALTFAVITALPHQTVHPAHHVPVVINNDLAPLMVPPPAAPRRAPSLKVPVAPAIPWLPYGQRGILA